MHDFNSFLILCTGGRCRGPPKCWRSRTRSKIERSSRILWSWEHPRKKFGRNYLVWDTVWTINDSRKTENQGLSAPRAPDWSPWVDSPWNSSLVGFDESGWTHQICISFRLFISHSILINASNSCQSLWINWINYEWISPQRATFNYKQANWNYRLCMRRAWSNQPRLECSWKSVWLKPSTTNVGIGAPGQGH